MTPPDNATLHGQLAALFQQGAFADVVAIAERNPTAVEGHSESAFIFALALARMGAIDRAASVMTALIEREPDNFDAHGALCKIFILKGEAEKAERLIRDLERRSLDDPRAALVLADALLQAGHVVDAHNALAAVNDKSNDLRIAVRLAETSIRMGDAVNAVSFARQALARAGLTQTTLSVAAPVALISGDENLYAACLEAIDRMPPAAAANFVDFWVGMLMAGDHLRAAGRAAEAAVRQAPTPDRLRLLADLRLAAKDVGGAETAARRALEMDRADAGALVLLARCQLYRSDKKGALATLHDALKADPTSAVAYDYLTQVEAGAVTDDMRAEMDRLAGQADLADDARSKLLLAVARCDERNGDYDRALANILEGKAIAARHAETRGRGYRAAQTEAMLDAMRNAFPAAPRPVDDGTEAGGGLIYIVGMPRSGTSLVEQILAGHREVFGAGELQATLDIVNPLFGVAVNGGDINEEIDRRAADMRGTILEMLPESASEKPFCTDKHPLNFWSLGVIARLFPRAKIVHVRRPPVDTCLSILRVRFFGDYTFANEIDSVAHYYACYEAMMDHWRAILGERIHDLDYTGLVKDPERETRALLAYCGLAWEPACLDFHTSKREVLTHSAAQVREPISNTSSQRGARYGAALTPLEEALENHRAALVGGAD